MKNFASRAEPADTLRWVLVVSLVLRCRAAAVQCVFSDHVTDVAAISMSDCHLTAGDLAIFTHLQRLELSNNSLTEFPDLSPSAATLTYLWLEENRISHLQEQHLRELVALKQLYLGGNLISQIDDDALLLLKKLEYLKIADNSLTAFPNLPVSPGSSQSKLMGLWLQNNQLHEAIRDDALLPLVNLRNLYLAGNMRLTRLPHPIQSLKRIRQLDISDTGITHLPPLLDANFADLTWLNIKRSVDVCKCENAWLKEKVGKIAAGSFSYDDSMCGGGHVWSSMTVGDMEATCARERNTKTEMAVYSTMMPTRTALKPFLLHAYIAGDLLTNCIGQCRLTTGCVSVYWRSLHAGYGDCAIIAPGDSISVDSVPGGSLQVWSYYPLT